MFQTSFRAMGGNNAIVVAAPDAGLAQAAMQAAAREVVRVQDKYSRYRQDPGSVVHCVNARAGTGAWTVCDEETMALLQLAGQFHRESEGLFDITSGVLRRVWNFKTARVPSRDEIARVLPLIDWNKVELQGGRVRLPIAGMEIDFGGFGKEYAADRAAAVLRAAGITSGFVNLGGDIAIVGPRGDGSGWPIGVENPRSKGAVVAALSISAGGVTTSGDAEYAFSINGKRYSHILNPRTGMPADCWCSVSVANVTTTLAGFYSTLAMLLESAAPAFLESRQCPYLLVDQAGKVRSAPAEHRLVRPSETHYASDATVY